MVARDLTQEALDKMANFKIEGLMPALKYLNSGAMEDVLNINGCANYQWVIQLVDILKPRQVVELGGAMGVWCLCVLHTLPETSKLYSITLEENGLEFSYIKENYPNLTKIVGDDLEMKNWKGVDLYKTDLWFFDTGVADQHFGHQLRRELDLYSPYFKKGAVVLFDDIHKNQGMEIVWEDLKKGKWGKFSTYNATDPLHFTGFGVTIYEGNDTV